MADSDVTVARRAYARAMECGAKPHIAFDVARAAFRARHPGLSGTALDDAVWLALGSLQDLADRLQDVDARRLAANMEPLAGRSEAQGKARSSLISAGVD